MAISAVDFARLWLEYCRRQLGQPRLSDDEFERLGHHAVEVVAPVDDPEL